MSELLGGFTALLERFAARMEAQSKEVFAFKASLTHFASRISKKDNGNVEMASKPLQSLMA